MEGITVGQVLDWASKLSLTSGLVLLIVAIVRGWLVPSYVVTQLREERDEWKKLAMGGQEIGERGTNLADRAAALAVEIIQRQDRPDRNRDERDRDERDRDEREERGERDDRRRR